MRTVNYEYMHRLDHLRFFAAMLVMYHHFRGPIVFPETIDGPVNIIKLWLTGGSTGVSLFLVLSGFIFCLITDCGKLSLAYGKFLKNRILRIAPLIVFIFFITISVNRAASTPMDILRLITLQLNTGNPVTGWGNEYFPCGPVWTVAVEFQFYMIFPFIILFVGKYGYRYLLGLTLIMILTRSMLVAFYGSPIYWNMYHTIIGRLDQFLMGIAAGCIYSYLKSDRNNRFISTAKRSMVCSAVILLSLTAMTFFIFYNSRIISIFIPVSFTVEAVIWSSLLIAYLELPLRIKPYINETLAYIGKLSFSIYLLHLPVGKAVRMIFVEAALKPMSAVVNTSIVIMPVTILVAMLTYSYIEKPFLEMRVRYIK